MNTNYDNIHDSDRNRLAYILCAMMDCRKCPVGYGHKCIDELKQWLDKPMDGKLAFKVCPECGEIVKVTTLLSNPCQYRVMCRCGASATYHDLNEAYADWEKRKAVPYRNFCRENLEAVMNAAGIPEGLQMKVLKIEGMGTKSCSETSEGA